MKSFIILCSILIYSISSQTTTKKTTTSVPFVNIAKGDLLWSDEFDYNGPPDPNKWYIQSNTVNNYYKVSNAWRDENAYVSGHFLTLEAKQESFNGKNYTSAAIISRQGFQYGIFEMRAKLGTGRGTWSNFWLFSDDRKSTRWPADGEIDIVEVVDSTNWTHNRVHGTIHNDKFDNEIKNPDTYRSKEMIGSKIVSDMGSEFHVYTLDWNEQRMNFYCDGYKYHSYLNDGTQDGWPFDRSMNILFNLKIGIPGDTWSGINGIDDSIFPVYHVIDYVRHYASPESPPSNSIMWENLPSNITWAPGCDFPGNEMKNETTRIPVTNQCIWKCQYNKGCSHFVWSNGICWMKKGPVSVNNAVKTDPNTVCGINNLA